jgi:hypothetical protein
MIIKQSDICFCDNSPVCIFCVCKTIVSCSSEQCILLLAEHYTHIRREVSYDMFLCILLRVSRFNHIWQIIKMNKMWREMGPVLIERAVIQRLLLPETCQDFRTGN